MKMNRTFNVKDKKFAEKLVDELESLGERTGAFDEAFGIWKGRPEKENELVEILRASSNHRND